MTSSQQTKQELILTAWAKLQRDSLGTEELKLLETSLAESFDGATFESPASIARTLADAGVKLRHAEVLRADNNWREQRLYGLLAPEELDFATLESSLTSLHGVLSLFAVFEDECDEVGQKMLIDLVVKVRLELGQVVASRGAPVESRKLAAEVSEWFLVWLQSPVIFADWLSLRLNSADFIEKFGNSGNV